MIDFQEFQDRWALTVDQICSQIVSENRDRIAIKKDKVAEKNMKRILDSVFSISRDKGFHAMTLRDLSRESGLSMGALYSYFSGKEDLRSMIQRQGVLQARKIILEQIAQYPNPEERLEAALRTHLYLSEILRPWFYFAYMEAASLPAKEKRKAMEDERATEQIFHDILSEGDAAGLFLCRDVGLAAALIKAMLQDWYLKRWKYKRSGTTVEAYATFVVQFVLNALRADRASGTQ